MKYKFDKNLYSKIALLKAAYNYTDRAYIHLDSDESYYYVNIEMRNGETSISEKEFVNEMLAQAVRHEIYIQTKDIRNLMYARAMATTIVGETDVKKEESSARFSEDEILKDWFNNDDT